MLTLQFNFSICYIVHKRANHHRNFALKELRKLVNFPRRTGENVCLINFFRTQHIYCILDMKKGKILKFNCVILLHGKLCDMHLTYELTVS